MKPWVKLLADKDGRKIFSVDPDLFYPSYFQELKDHLGGERAKAAPRIEELRQSYANAEGNEKRLLKRELDVEEANLPVEPERLDQYWLEVCYQCMKMDLQAEFGFNIEIRVNAEGRRKDKWTYDAHPEGLGAERAARGKEARKHFESLRGFLPRG